MIKEADLNEEVNAPSFRAIAVGSHHSMAVAISGDIFVSGSNEKGQLGLPGVETCDMFTNLHSCENYCVSDVFAGGEHSFILLDGFLKEKDRWREPVVPPSDNDSQQSYDSIVQALSQVSLTIQCNYTDTKLSHRFCRFQALNPELIAQELEFYLAQLPLKVYKIQFD